MKSSSSAYPAQARALCKEPDAIDLSATERYPSKTISEGNDVTLQVRKLTTDAEITEAFPLMFQLRPSLHADQFVASVRRQQQESYRLFGGFHETRLMVLAGVREQCTLMRGPHLFVDDLVTEQSKQRRGHGAEMLRWLAHYAAGRGFERIYLDSRHTATEFYEKLGFTLTRSVPCWIEVAALTMNQSA